MNDVLAKPIVPYQLLTKIAEWGAKAELMAEAAGKTKRG